MKKTLKKFISIALAVAMIVSSLTYYHSDISAAQSDAAAYDWTGVGYLATNGPAASCANKYKVHLVDGNANFVEIQTYDAHTAIYTTFSDAVFGKITCNGVDITSETDYHIQGAGIFFYTSTYTSKYNEVIVYSNDNTTIKAQFYVYYEDGTDGGSGGESSSAAESSESSSQAESVSSADPYAGETWKTASNAAYRVCIVGENTTQEFNGVFQVQNTTELYIAGSGQVMPANYQSATLNGNALEIWTGALVTVSTTDLTNNADNELIITDLNGVEHTVIIRAGRPSYEEVEPIDPETITITPNSSVITNQRRIEATWSNPTGTATAYAYIGSINANNGPVAANGWNFNQQAAQPMVKVDTVTRTVGGATIDPGETYTLIVVAYNLFGDLVGQGSIDIAIPDLDDTARAKQKINTSENLALNKTVIVAEGNNENTKQNITDGNAGTRWQADKTVDNSFFAVDLGEAKSIGSVLVCWEGSKASSYEVQLSDDGVNYHTVKTEESLPGGSVDRLSSFTSEEARYVKILATALSVDGANYGISPWELAVFAGEESYTTVPDNTWVDVGIFNVYSSWTDRKSAYLGTGTDDDMHVKFIGAHVAEWDSQFGIDVANLTSGLEYNYSISFTSNKAGTMSMQVPGAAGAVTINNVAIVSGDNTITGTFTAGTDPAHGQIMLFPEGMADGTIFSFSDVTVTRMPQKAAPAGFTVAYTDDLGNIQFNWTTSADYTTANLYVDNVLYASGPITNGQIINVSNFGHAAHSYAIEGVTSDSYGTTLRTDPVNLGMVPQKSAPEFTATYTNNNEDILINWSAESAITEANLYVDGVAFEDNPIDRGDTISVSDIGEGIHYFSIAGITSDIYGITTQSGNVYLYDYDATLTYLGDKSYGLFPDSRQGVGNNYSRFHDTSASASVGDNTANYSIDTATNGTMWSSGTHASLDNPQYITVDFGKVRPVSEVDIWWEGANAREYKIQISSDNTNWTDVAELSTSAREEARTDFISFYNEKSARYVRIYCQVQSNGYGYGIYDIGIYGSDSEDWIDPVPSNLTVTHTYGLEAADDYLTVSFDCGLGAEATYNVYAEFPDDGHEGFQLLGTIPASGSRVYGTESFKIPNRPGNGQNNQIRVTSVVNGVESDPSATYTLHYDRVTLSSTALGTFSPTYQIEAANEAFPTTKNDGALYDYTRYYLLGVSSSSGTASATIDHNAETLLNSATSDPQWVTVDLRSEYRIKEFDILWAAAKASDYYIQVSNDGVNYTNAYIVRNALVKDGDNDQRVDHIVLTDMVTARYVRFYGTARDITNQYEYNIREFAIYGPDEDKSGPDMVAPSDQELIDPATIDDDDWVRMNNQLSKTGATAWVTQATKDKMAGVGTVAAGFYPKSTLHANWNDLNTTTMYNDVGDVWGFYPITTGGVTTGSVTGLIINGVDYINPTDTLNEKVLILNNQCVYVNQDLMNAEPGETKYYTVTVKGNTLDTFIVKVVGADVFSYTIGGDGETPVTYNNDTPGVNVNEFNGIGGYSFSFASRNNGFYKSKTIDGATYANYLRYANTSATGTSERQLAGYAIDSVDRQYGNAGTRWESTWDSPYSTGEGITIDLGGIYDVSALDIYWERANAKNFNVQVSEDGTTWKEVFRATKVNANYDTGEVDPNSQNGGHIYRSDRVDSIKLLSDTSARYVKITGTVKNLTTVGEYGYSIWDVAVYGPTPSNFVDNVYAAYLRDEVVYTRWEEVFGADSYRVTLYNSLGNAVSTTTRGSAELASVIDATGLAEGTYTVKVESYDGNTKLGEGTKTVVIDRPQSSATIHENAGIGPYAGGTDSYGATVSYYASIKDVHETPETPENLNLGVTCVSDSGYDYIDVSYNYDLTNVKQAVVFADGKQVTATDGVIEWDGQKLQINETKIPEGTITTYDIYLTNAHVRLVVTKGEITSSQVAELFKSPTDLTVHAGDPYTFSGSAGGSNITYQWQYQDGVGEWTNIDGATLTSVQGVGKMTINGRKFRFIAQAHAANGTNYGRAVTSNAATLTVLPRVVNNLELRNDDGDVIAQWPAVDGATGYTLQYTYGGNTITVDNIPADTLSYDFTSAYTADATKGYPDNGSTVTVTPTGTGSPMEATALADLYVVSVEVNDGAALVAGETYDSVLVMKNKGTAWVDISTSNFTATASTTGWTPTITGTTKEKFLPDMVDSHSLTYTGFRPASAGDYTISYSINTKMVTVEAQEVHAITEGTWVPQVNPYANNSKSVSVTVAAEPPTIKVDSSKAGVQGFQIRTNQGEDLDDDRFDGTVAFRTVCRAPAVGQTFTARDGREYTVANVGIIYSLDDNTSGDSKDMTITAANTILNPTPVNEQYTYEGKGDNASITKGYIATQAAVLETANGYSTYAITMQGMNALMANSMLVRSFIVATDGTLIYSTKLVKVSIAEIAEYMYYNSLCNNDNGHQYLYDAILHSTTLGDANEGHNKYYRTETVEYGWNSTIYDKLPN